MPQRGGHHFLYNCVQTGALALVLLVIAGLSHLGSGSFVPFAFAGGFLIHLCLRPSSRELAAATTIGAIYAAAYYLQSGTFAQIPASTIGTVGGFLGLGSVVVKGTEWIWSDGDQKTAYLKDLAEIALLPALCLSSGLAVSLVAGLIPETYDLFLYAFDSRLGLHSSFTIGQSFRGNPALGYVSACVYNCLPIYLAAFRAHQIRHPNAGGPDVRHLLIGLGLAGFLLYLICPASGPVHCFKTFPDSPPSLNSFSVERIPVVIVPRNAIPSLHFGWALLMCLYAWMRRSWVLGIFSTIFAFFTALATLGSGEHYVIDLIVAVPLVIAVLAACSASSVPGGLFRYEVLAGSGITLGWLLCLRFRIFMGMSPVACWGLVALSLLLSLALLAVLVKRGSVQAFSSSGAISTSKSVYAAGISTTRSVALSANK